MARSEKMYIWENQSSSYIYKRHVLKWYLNFYFSLYGAERIIQYHITFRFFRMKFVFKAEPIWF